MKYSIKACFLFLIFQLALIPTSQAFYYWQEDNRSLELRGLLRIYATASHNPHISLLYKDSNISGTAAVGRLIADSSLSDKLSFEAQMVAGYVPQQIRSRGSRIQHIADVERSDSLNISADNNQARLFIDRLNLQYESESLHLKVGRQPVNLAATYYFTPNDFFAPFAAQTFYRAYKPGVDAARADIQLGELSQLSFIGVLGYELDSDNDTFWSKNPKANQSSLIARASTVFKDFEIALLAGSIKKDQILGIDMQGELFDWLGIRAEGHYFMPQDGNQNNRIEFALGLEHRWENSLTIRVEQFYHGQGAKQSEDYALIKLLPNPETTYLARHYSALGASYEVTPLLNTDALYLYNWVDQSQLIALNAVYSLSDESELVFNLNIPMGDKAEGLEINSEFGNQGKSISLEWRQYF